MNNSNSTEEKQVVSFTIFGEPASKANSRKLVRYGGVSRLIKSTKALNYSDMFKQQCPQLAHLMSDNLAVTMTIYYATRRPDLDESLILDLMQGFIYKNDRQVKEKHVYWGLDRENPRTEIRVEKRSPPKGAKEKDTGEKTVPE